MKRYLYWIWLSLRLGEGNSRFVGLIERFGSPEAIFDAEQEELLALRDEFGEHTMVTLLDRNLDEAYQIETYCASHRIQILTFGSEDYPKLLTNLKNPPIILYARGKCRGFDKKVSISVVGTRTLTEYGRKTAYKMGYELAKAGVVVVSGMALGIDSVAACGALDAGGFTVAVLGSGLDCVYPAAHKKLAAEIAAKGLVLSEYPPLVGPTRYSFPMRNRIISGLGLGTVVVEADDKSGSLITARDAIMQGRDVFAVPGNVDAKNATGTNSLIKDGATAVTSAADILENYRYLYRGMIDVTEPKRVSAKSELVRGALAKHGVAEGVPDGEPLQKDAPLSRLLHAKKKVDGETVKAISKTPEHPVFEKDKVPAEPAPHISADESVKVLSGLDDVARKVFELMPIGTPVSIDRICESSELEAGEVMIAFTMLEVSGLARALPGGLYCRL